MNVNRVIFVFRDFCPIKCKYCYTPFDNKGSGNIDLWNKVLNKVLELNPQIITFSGGDPLFYPDFIKFINKLKSNNDIEYQLHTNGIFFKIQYLDVIKKKIDVIGFPLDGTLNYHESFGNKKNHFNKVLYLLDLFQKTKIKIEVHTVVTKKNYFVLNELSKILLNYKINKWILYQFWPMETNKLYWDEYNIDDKTFLNTAGEIKNNLKNSNIRILSYLYKDRSSCYFLVSSLGLVYTVDNNDTTKYEELCSIFDPNLEKYWKKYENIFNENTKIYLNSRK